MDDNDDENVRRIVTWAADELLTFLRRSPVMADGTFKASVKCVLQLNANRAIHGKVMSCIHASFTT